MHKILMVLRQLLAQLMVRDCPPDPLAALSPRDWADLPAIHPQIDAGADPCAC
jgi:hypothetical protein